MSRSAALLPLLCAGATLFGCAPQPGPMPAVAAGAPQGHECFHASQVNSFKALGDEAVDVQVGVRKYYRMQLAGVCPNIRWTQSVALRTLGGSPWICQGLDAEIISPNFGLGPERCLVTNVRRLSDAEARALRYYR